MVDFEVGETVQLNLETKDSDTNTLVDPDTVEVKIKTIDSVVQDWDSMNKISTGNYRYEFEPLNIGLYGVAYRAIRAGKTTILKSSFYASSVDAVES